jgi:hypothetical protein
MGLAGQRGWRWLNVAGWDWKKNRDFLYHAMKNAKGGKARILDIGFDPKRGFKGKITLDEIEVPRRKRISTPMDR